MKSIVRFAPTILIFSAISAADKIEHRLNNAELSQFRYVASQRFTGCYQATDVKGLNVDAVKLMKTKKCRIQGYNRQKGFMSLFCSDSPFSLVLGEGEHGITYAKTEAKCWEFFSGLQNSTYDPYRHDLIAGEARNEKVSSSLEKNDNAAEEETYIHTNYLLFSVHSVTAAYTAKIRYEASAGSSTVGDYAHLDKGLKYELEFGVLIGPRVTKKNFNERVFPALLLAGGIAYANFQAPTVTSTLPLKNRDYAEVDPKLGFALKFPYGFVYGALVSPMKLGLTDLVSDTGGSNFLNYYKFSVGLEVETGLMFVFDRFLMGVRYRLRFKDFPEKNTGGYYPTINSYPRYYWNDSGLREEWSIAVSMGFRFHL